MVSCSSWPLVRSLEGERPVVVGGVCPLTSRSFAEETGVIMSTTQLELAAARIGLVVDDCCSTEELIAAVDGFTSAVEEWWDDEVIRGWVSKISSAAHADSVRVRVEGVLIELRRSASDAGSVDRPFPERRSRCHHVVQEARRALLAAAMSVRPGL